MSPTRVSRRRLKRCSPQSSSLARLRHRFVHPSTQQLLDFQRLACIRVLTVLRFRV